MAKQGRGEGQSIVVPIFKAKRLCYSARPAAIPPYEMRGLWATNVPERNRSVILEADIKADIRVGDPGLTALRKALYLIENVGRAYQEHAAAEELVLFMVELVKNYGEPEGVPVLRRAHELFGQNPTVSQDIAFAAAFIGSRSDADLILAIVKAHPSSERSRQALLHFASRFRSMAPELADALEPLPERNGCLKETIRELRSLHGSGGDVA